MQALNNLMKPQSETIQTCDHFPFYKHQAWSDRLKAQNLI